MRRVMLAVALAATAVLWSASPAAAATAPPANSIVPFLNCYWDNGNGTYTVSVGYRNTTATSWTIPVGADNSVQPSPADRGQPTVFSPGTNNNVWAPTVNVAEINSGANWYVNGRAVDIGAGAAPCSSKPVVLPVAASSAAAGLFGGILVLGLVLRPLRRRLVAAAAARREVSAA